MSFFEWNLRRSDVPLHREVRNSFNLPDFILNIVKNRGIASYQAMMEYAYPQSISLPSPFFMGDMDKAVCRINEAIEKKEKILIFGDKDADGVTSTAIMHRILSRFGAQVEFRVPEGVDHYGLSREAIIDAYNEGVTLIITVDCGITAVEEAKFAKEQGLDLIITDHHEPLEELPEAVALINPKLNDYPFPFLSGAGVALKAAQALAESRILPDWYDQEYVFFDIETTGLDPENDEITEIAAIIVKNGIEIASFQTLVKITGTISQEISQITNITQEMLDQQGLERDIALQKFLDFIGDKTLAGQNIINFDIKFINAQLKKGLKKTISNHAIDTLNLARSLFKSLKSYKLSDIGEHLGIYTDPNALHRALVDVRLNAEVFRRMTLKRSEPLMQLLCELFPLAAVGTVADIMPLQDENRTIVRVGIENIKQASTGLIALIRRLNILENLDARSIGWTLGPVLNSPGRLGEAGLVVSLLITNNINKANELSEQLLLKDNERKNLVSSLEEEIISCINVNEVQNDKHILIISNNIPRGITGLIATRLANQFQVPVIIVARSEDGQAAGSIRATGSFDVVAFLQFLSPMLTQFGGHKAAGGFVLGEEHLSSLKDQIIQYMKTWSSETLRNTIEIDVDLNDFSMLSIKNINYMHSLLNPIGSKNPAPNFLVRDAQLIEAKPIGRNKEHLIFTFLKGKTEFKTIAWSFAERWDQIQHHQTFDIVGIPEINIWNDIEEVRLQLVDISPKGE